MRWDNAPDARAARVRFRALKPPCARCGRPIDWDGPRFVPHPVTGKPVGNPDAFDLGHVVDKVYLAPGERPQFQAEHSSCNRTAGAALGNARKAARRGDSGRVPVPVHSEPW